MPHLLENLKDRTELYYTCADRLDKLATAVEREAPPPWWQFWRIYW